MSSKQSVQAKSIAKKSAKRTAKPDRSIIADNASAEASAALTAQESAAEVQLAPEGSPDADRYMDVPPGAVFGSDGSMTVPSLPVVPVGATHYRLTRKLLELASDVKHFEDDIAALGQRPGDVLEFGTMTANGSFTSNSRALAKSANGGTRTPRGTGKMALIDSLIIEGTHTAKSVVEQVVAKFGGDTVKTLVVVRSRPWAIKKAGKLAADAVPFAPAVRDLRAAKVVMTPEEKDSAKLAKKVAAARALLASLIAA